MLSGRQKVALVLGLVAVVGAGGALALRAGDAGARGPVAAGVGAAGPTAAGEGGGAADTPSAAATSSVPAAAGRGVLEPGPGMPVATDTPRENTAGSVTVVLTFTDVESGAVEAAGYVAGVVEDGGTCTLTLERGADSVSTQSPGEADATTTTCAGLSIDAARLAAGSWTAVLGYKSHSSSGTSSAVAVQVPPR